MTERVPKSILFGGVVVAPIFLAYLAYSRPWYFTNQTYLGGLILFEVLVAAVWMYRRAFFPVVIVSFLLAGANLPVGAIWTTGRWLFLSVGAVFGFFIVLRERRYPFGLFHITALFAVLTALLSATVSRYPAVALLKVLSFFILFLYAGTGARVAVRGRENAFFAKLLLGCEIFVGITAVLYGIGIEAMGNPNSLGAVMGIVGAPLLLWGMLIAEDQRLRQRRGVLLAIALFLGFISHSRAGLAAGFISSGLLCLALRKHKLFIEGLVGITIVLAGTAMFRPEFVASTTSSILYKGGDREHGIFLSRESPWHDAIENIREHPWFGSGLGTTADEGDPALEQANYSSTAAVTSEHGSSYLAIAAGVGAVGSLPFSILLAILIRRILCTFNWLRKNGVAAHPAVPLAFIILAGLVHAAFEDWMFAAGSYLCVFFWAIAFIFLDVSSTIEVQKLGLSWRSQRGAILSHVVVSNR